MSEQIPIIQIAHNSEWALAKFFSSLGNPHIKKLFRLTAVCGIDKSKEEAIRSLRDGICAKAGLLSNGCYRAGNRGVEIESATDLMIKLSSGEIKYYPIRDNATLPEEAYRDARAVVIHSKNPTHIGYLEDATKHGMHMLCEKPIVPVLNTRGRPYGEDLAELSGLIEVIGENGLVAMDAEHYSYKKAAITFYENKETILAGKKIKKIQGEIKEIDDPEFWRTKSIISPGNQTGVLGDTACHLLAFISNLGGAAHSISREYDMYQDSKSEYFVDTYDRINCLVSGGDFSKDAQGEIEVGKFVDRMKIPQKESKLIRFTLEDDSEVVLNFNNGAVVKRAGGKEKEFVFRYVVDGNEYVNILSHFYESVVNGSPIRTSLRNAKATLNTILEAYSLPLDRNVRQEVYKK